VRFEFLLTAGEMDVESIGVTGGCIVLLAAAVGVSVVLAASTAGDSTWVGTSFLLSAPLSEDKLARGDSGTKENTRALVVILCLRSPDFRLSFDMTYC